MRFIVLTAADDSAKMRVNVAHIANYYKTERRPAQTCVTFSNEEWHDVLETVDKIDELIIHAMCSNLVIYRGQEEPK